MDTPRNHRNVPSLTETGIDVDPSAVDRAAQQLGGLSPSPMDWDPSLLTEDVIGHAGLAAALREFKDQLDLRMNQLAIHQEKLAAALHQAGRNYRNADV